MPVFPLFPGEEFPSPEFSDPSGLLAIGGDLLPETLLAAYRSGIFPWYNESDPILWWSPDPRFVLFPDNLKISKSMLQVIRSGRFRITYDKAFKRVIESCKIMPRKGQEGTWISREMKDAYIELHKLGYAHSVEAWDKELLTGGLYGVSLGGCFFGESMFSKVSNASKAAFFDLVRTLSSAGFGLIDCQVYTRHLERLGAELIERSHFLALLSKELSKKDSRGSWKQSLIEHTS